MFQGNVGVVGQEDDSIAADNHRKGITRVLSVIGVNYLTLTTIA